MSTKAKFNVWISIEPVDPETGDALGEDIDQAKLYETSIPLENLLFDLNELLRSYGSPYVLRNESGKDYE